MIENMDLLCINQLKIWKDSLISTIEVFKIMVVAHIVSYITV